MKDKIIKNQFSVLPKDVIQMQDKIEKEQLERFLISEQKLIVTRMAFVITISLESGQKLPDLSVLLGDVPFDSSDDVFELNQDWVKLSMGTEPTTRKILSNYRAILLAAYNIEKRDKLMDELAWLMSNQEIFSFVIQV